MPTRRRQTRRRQAGGAKKYIGSLTDIKNPADLEANCEFNYLIAHGMTIRNRMMIVPENTFILFVGQSGFSMLTGQAMESLIHAPTPEAYMKHMYQAFFEEVARRFTNNAARPFTDTYIYTPGDIIHNTSLSFKNGLEIGYLRMGMFPLPLADTSEFITKRGTLPKTLTLPTFVKLMNTGQVSDDIIARAEPITAEGINKLREYTSYREVVEGELRSGDRRDLSVYFKKPEVIINEVITPYAARASGGNKIRLEDYRGAKSDLAEVLQRTGSEKRYRFIVVTACRPPDIDTEGVTDEEYHRNRRRYEAADPVFLPAGVNRTRRMMRRHSFSVKGEDEACPLGPGLRPMNLEFLARALRAAPPNAGGLARILRGIFLDESGAYKPTVRTAEFIRAIDALFKKYPGGGEVTQAILETGRAIFKSYLLGLKSDVEGNEAARNLLPGATLAHQLRLPDKAPRYAKEEEAEMYEEMSRAYPEWERYGAMALPKAPKAPKAHGLQALREAYTRADAAAALAAEGK